MMTSAATLAQTYTLLVILCSPMQESPEEQAERAGTHVSAPSACRIYEPPWLRDLPLDGPEGCRGIRRSLMDALRGPGVRFECVAE